jgi:hypothetical protein
MVLLHAGDDPVDWVIPSGWGENWSVFTDTAERATEPSTRHHHPGEALTVTARSLVALLRV